MYTAFVSLFIFSAYNILRQQHKRQSLYNVALKPLNLRLLKNGVSIMENTRKNLSELEVGKWGRVRRLNTKGDMRRRLQDIGLVEGTRIRCLRKSPSGDPTAYLIRGAVIALRNDTSSEIVLE